VQGIANGRECADRLDDLRISAERLAAARGSFCDYELRHRDDRQGRPVQGVAGVGPSSSVIENFANRPIEELAALAAAEPSPHPGLAYFRPRNNRSENLLAFLPA
jgi:hypothetical protein